LAAGPEVTEEKAHVEDMWGISTAHVGKEEVRKPGSAGEWEGSEAQQGAGMGGAGRGQRGAI
jgi:hypothetical protein